jgi:hypothetical protein
MASKSVQFHNMVFVHTIVKSDIRAEHPPLKTKIAEWDAYGHQLRAQGLAGYDTHEDIHQDMLDIKRRQEEYMVHTTHKKMQKLRIRVA